MRRIHRWFGIVTGVWMALIASTGIAMQVIDLVSPEHHQPGSPGPGGPGLGGSGPPGPHLFEWRGLLDHIHDGEVLGTTGRVISLLLGVALLLFSVSGIWMYWQMFRARHRNGRTEIFW